MNQLANVIPTLFKVVITISFLLFLCLYFFFADANLTEVAGMLKYATLSTTCGGAIIFIFIKLLWRIKQVRKALMIPDLSGRWEGWSYRFYAEKHEWRPAVHEVSQTASSIEVIGFGPGNKTTGTTAEINQNSHGGAIEFIWSFQASMRTIVDNPHLPNSATELDASDNHIGTHFLTYSTPEDGLHRLEGTYVTQRIIEGEDGAKQFGAGGFNRLYKVSSRLKNTLDYNPAGWANGVNEPTGPPIHPATVSETTQPSEEKVESVDAAESSGTKTE